MATRAGLQPVRTPSRQAGQQPRIASSWFASKCVVAPVANPGAALIHSSARAPVVPIPASGWPSARIRPLLLLAGSASSGSRGKVFRGTHWRRIALRSVDPGTPCCLAISAGRCPALDSLTHPALFSLVMDHGRLKAPGQEKSDGATSRLRPAQFIRVGGATNSAGLSRPTAMTCPLLVNLASAHRRPP